ncbi:hypothetical protein ABEB36_007437 [Hypothenemus hampei]|uniref:Glucosylceramidase n=1 Tax=Hypothenemus hampei TaxID=57062 RepID=A0ABD1EUV6_HYPHA
MNPSNLVVILSFLSTSVLAADNCDFRLTSSGGYCICNSTYCDTVPPLVDLKSGEYQFYSTSKTNLGFGSVTGKFSVNSFSEVTVTININNTHQRIFGFGGAFTDATGINIKRLPEKAQELLLEAYFGENGIQYSIGRVPIGGTDFSTKGYTYCDTEDETLAAFALQPEDNDYKIPFLKKAIQLRGQENIKFFASAWSAPIWMKTNDEYNGFGKIKDEYYATWAYYYLKFFDAYKEQGIDFWAVTTQNEPINGLIGTSVQNNGFSYDEMKIWIKDYLGPTIRNSTYSDIKIIAHDDQRFLIPLLNNYILSDEETVNYIDGIGVHWYTDFIIPPEFLIYASSQYKDLFVLSTEACIDSVTNQGVVVDFGSWHRGERYLDDIMDDLSYDVIGWVDWNMVLNETGGPTWISNEVDSPIIVNGTDESFYKQPMFYAIGHFSKFVVPNSIRVDADIDDTDVRVLAFVRPDEKIAVVLWNKSSDKKEVTVNILDKSGTVTLDPLSINTLLYAK